MSRLWLTAAVVAGAAAALGAQTSRPFKSGIDLVTVDVLVTDGRRPVSGLRAADFELRDEGVVQSIAQVQIETLPLNVIFVLDTSQSVSGTRLAHLKAAADSIVSQLGASDRVALLTFSHALRRHAALTSDFGRVKRTIAELSASGATAMRDAVAAGLALRGTDRGRALVVVFSDGVDTASFLPAERVFNQAARSDVVAYGVGFPSAPPPLPGGSTVHQRQQAPGSDTFLRTLAAATGGRVEIADGDDDIARAFGRVLAEFRARYVLGFTPTGVPRSGWHKLEVKLKQRRGVVTARRGYFAR